jgi:succinate dehydrogenase / fumarate reductase cytochrome b subunit
MLFTPFHHHPEPTSQTDPIRSQPFSGKQQLDFQNMGWIGGLILIFILIHLANFWARIKLGIGAEVNLDAQGYKDVYEVSYSLFQNLYYVLFYTVLMIPLGLHLYHGLESGFKTLGFYHYKGSRILAKVSLIYAAVISIGFGIIPLIVYLK